MRGAYERIRQTSRSSLVNQLTHFDGDVGGLWAVGRGVDVDGIFLELESFVSVGLESCGGGGELECLEWGAAEVPFVNFAF